jgi:hypothetical protein
VTAFCRERGLREGRLYAWKKRLREAEAGRFVEVRVRTTEETAAVSRGGIEVRLRGGHSLVVEPGFDAHHLRALLSVLEGIFVNQKALGMRPSKSILSAPLGLC